MITTRAVPALPPRHRRAARPSRALQHSCPRPPGVRHHLPVDRSELLTALNRDGINPSTYSLEGGHPPDRAHRLHLVSRCSAGIHCGARLPAIWPRRSRRRAARGPAPPVKRPETSEHTMQRQTTLGAVIPRDIPPSVTAAPRT
jgi:hypothetical protein